MASPSLLAQQVDQLINHVNLLRDTTTTSLTAGVLTNSASSQAAGAGGALNYDVDIAACTNIVINGVMHGTFGAQADADDDAGAAVAWGAVDGKSMVFAVVVQAGASNTTAALGYVAVPGAVAASGAQVPPTDAEITAVVGHAYWAMIGDHTVNRTATTALTHSFSYTRRPSQKLAALGTLATSEATFV